MSGGMPELGSKISLISKADIRYEGRLYTVDPQECTIALSSVRSFGTEDRETQFQIAPQSQIYDYILFRGSDIKDIRVVNNSLPHPNDPAIMQVQLPNGQHIMPHFPMPSMNPPHAAPMGAGVYGNPFGAMSGLGGMGGAAASASLAPGSGAGGTSGSAANFMLNSQQQQQQQQQNKQQQQQKQPISVIDLLAGASRSTTPISLISRKSPSADMGVQVNQQHHNQQQHHHNNNNQQQQHHNHQQNNGGGHGSSSGGHGGGNSRDAGHKRQNHHQPQHQRVVNNNNNQRNNNDYYHPRDRRDSSGRNMDNYSNQHHDNRGGNNYNNQRNNQPGQNRAWTMHRGQNNGGGGGGSNNNMMRSRGGGGGGGRGRMSNQGYRPMGVPPIGIQNKPRGGKTTIKFEQDFDFEQANNKFEELCSQLSKIKVGEEPKVTEQCSSPTAPPQINGETDKKDDSGNETGAGEHEPEDEEVTVGYDKTKSFFDNISCEAAQDRSKNKKNDWRQERKLNSETFGVSSTRRGGYRGRGNYYNRNMGSFNAYNRGYRGANSYNRNHRNSNNRMIGANSNGNPGNNHHGGGSNDTAALKNQQPQNMATAAANAATTTVATPNVKTTTTQENNTQPQVAAVRAAQ